MKTAEESSKNDTRKVLTSVVSEMYCTSVPGFPHVRNALEHQVKHDAKRLNAVNRELKSLHDKYLRYRELVKDRSTLEERLRVSLSIYLDAGKDVLDNLRNWQGLAIASTDQERLNTPLWKVIREIVRHTEKIRIVDLEAQLKDFGYTITRQAIESAIKTHSSAFRESKHGREKFVSLR